MKKFTKISIGLTAVGAFLLVISYGSFAFAQTAQKPSDYATDVKDGQLTIQNDPVTASNAREVNEAEVSEGDVDNEPVEIKETIEPAEATEAVEASEPKTSDGGGTKQDSDKSSPTNTGGNR